MKKYILCIIIIIFCLHHVSHIYAAYVLPYPSYMPGNKIYKISCLFDRIKSYWYFGTRSQLKYHMALADKYLVEAKVLFEYNQYPLAIDALNRSDNEILEIKKLVEVNTFLLGEANLALVESEKEKHKEIIESLKMSVPEVFEWSPEKVASTTLQIRYILDKSIDVRDSVSATK